MAVGEVDIVVGGSEDGHSGEGMIGSLGEALGAERIVDSQAVDIRTVVADCCSNRRLVLDAPC